MSITLDQLLAGVRQVESGGNYSVVNGIGAVGAYQVMKANIPSWTRKALGYSLTWQQFRDSKAAQDKVARVILGGYFRKYGAEGAASMWFSGQPNPNSRASDGGNTVRQYVDKVMRSSGAAPADFSSGGSTGIPVAPKLDADELAEQYGLTSTLINSSKELKRLFNQAVGEGWSPAKFQASLKNSRWWQTQSDTLRKYITTKYSDPATFAQNWKAGQFAVNSLAVAVGWDSQINKKGQSSKILKEAIYNKLALGWSDDRLKSWFAARVHIDNGADSVLGGEVGDAFNKLHELAYLNGMKYSDWYGREARDIASGKTTMEEAEGLIRRQAAARYSAYREQILAGQNVLDLAAPYIKTVSQLLELPETDVDLANKHVAKAMSAKPGKGAEGGSQMPLWQFENQVREDPLWRKTNNARESMMTVARQVAKDFGLAF